MWRFSWYRSNPSDGVNPWQDWYDGQEKWVHAKHDNQFGFLEVNELANWKFTRPLFDGLIEVKIDGKVAHRLIGFFNGEKHFCFVLACTHKGKVYDPKDALDTAKRRMDEIKQNPKKAVSCARPRKAGRVARSRISG